MNKWLENFAYDIVIPSAQNQPELVDICPCWFAGVGNCFDYCKLAKLAGCNEEPGGGVEV